MKRQIAAVLIALLPALGALADGEGGSTPMVLFWSFLYDDTVARHGEQVPAFDLNPGVDLYARVSYDGAGGSGYLLQPSDVTPGGGLPDFDVYQIDLPDDPDVYPLGWYADVTDYAGYSFTVELGNWEAAESGSEGTWTTLAVSETKSYDALAGTYIQKWSDVAGALPVTAWHPSFAVPEPTSGLLLVFGAAALALRRRRGFRRA